MSTTKIFVPAGVKVDSTYLAHVGQQSVEQNLEELTVEPAGDWAPNFTGHASWQPEFSLQSFDLTKVLDLCTVNVICADLSAATVKLFKRAVTKAAMAVAVGESSHLVYQMLNNSMLVWDRISINQRSEAEISFRLVAFTASGAAILVPLPSQTIEAAGTIVAPFTIGPIEVTKVSGSPLLITGIKSLTWNLNPEVVKEDADGDATPGFVYVRRVRPVIELQTTDVQVVHDNFDDDGNGLSKVTTWFRRRRPNKINYADNEAQHAKLESDGTAAAIATLAWTGVQGDPTAVSVRIALQRAGAGALFAYAKDQAIVTGAGTTTTTTTTGGG
jgi:hypothetical protein